MNRNSKFIVPILTWIVISLSLFLSIFVKVNRPLDLEIMPRYILVGFVGFILSYFLRKFDVKTSNLFLILSLLSGIYLYIAMPMSPEEFGQLGALLSWLILMGVSLAMTLIYGLIRYFRK